MENTPITTNRFYLWYDGLGLGHCDDCASSHATLEAAINAAKSDWQPRQHITDDAEGQHIVWSNYAIEILCDFIPDGACQACDHRAYCPAVGKITPNCKDKAVELDFETWARYNCALDENGDFSQELWESNNCDG